MADLSHSRTLLGLELPVQGPGVEKGGEGQTTQGLECQTHTTQTAMLLPEGKHRRVKQFRSAPKEPPHVSLSQDLSWSCRLLFLTSSQSWLYLLALHL